MSISLRTFALFNLNPTSGSTNPSHRQLMAYTALQVHSEKLSDEQYEKCHAYIDRGFDQSVFSDTDETVQIEKLNETMCS